MKFLLDRLSLGQAVAVAHVRSREQCPDLGHRTMGEQELRRGAPVGPESCTDRRHARPMRLPPGLPIDTEHRTPIPDEKRDLGRVGAGDLAHHRGRLQFQWAGPHLRGREGHASPTEAVAAVRDMLE